MEEHRNDRLRATAEAKDLNATREELVQHVREVGRSKNLALIVATERTFVQGDLDRYANGSEIRGSLTVALQQFDAMERLIGIVDDPARYREVDKDHSLSVNRKNGLPFDEARQGFSSHHARLTNMTKGRLTEDERQVIEARKTAIREAGKLYTEKQGRTLGVTLA